MDISNKIVLLLGRSWNAKAKNFLLRATSRNWRRVKAVCHTDKSSRFSASVLDHRRWQKEVGRWQGLGEGGSNALLQVACYAVQPRSLPTHRPQQAAALHLHPQWHCLPTVFWPHMLYVMTALAAHRSGGHTDCDGGRGESHNVVREMRYRFNRQRLSYMNQSIKCHRPQF